MTPRAKQLTGIAVTLVLAAAIGIYSYSDSASTVDRSNQSGDEPVAETPNHGSATISHGPIDRMGSLSDAQVASVLDAQNDTLMPCYTQALGETPDLEGTTTINLMIGRDGAVSAAFHIGSTFGNQPFEECLVDVFEGWRFPTAESGVTRLLVPYAFNP